MAGEFRHKGIRVNYVVKIFKKELVQTPQHPALMQIWSLTPFQVILYVNEPHAFSEVLPTQRKEGRTICEEKPVCKRKTKRFKAH